MKSGISSDNANIKFSIGGSNNLNRYMEELLGLAPMGYDQHYLNAENHGQTVLVSEWYDHHPWLKITKHALCYNKKLKRFDDESAASAWVAAHPGMEYYLGNEPDLQDSKAGIGMNAREYADFYHYASQIIRIADPSAYLCVAAWAAGIARYDRDSLVYGPTRENENDMLTYYFDRYGVIDAQAFSVHIYQSGTPTNPFAELKLNKFAEFTQAWKKAGMCTTDQFEVTEFGWNGNDRFEGEWTTENCINFMDWFIPKMALNSQVLNWHWWQWKGESNLVWPRDETGIVTKTGEYYSHLAHR